MIRITRIAPVLGGFLVPTQTSDVFPSSGGLFCAFQCKDGQLGDRVYPYGHDAESDSAIHVEPIPGLAVGRHPSSETRAGVAEVTAPESIRNPRHVELHRVRVGRAGERGLSRRDLHERA